MVAYDPFSDEALDDPLPIYRELREHAPAYYLDEFDCWALSRFEDIWVQTGDVGSYSAAARGTTPAHLLTGQLPVFPSVNLMDPPEHTRNRALISGAFKPRRVATLAPLVREIVGRHIDAVARRGGCDLVGDFIAKVSMEVSCNLLGLPVEDADFLSALVNRFFERERGRRGMTESGLAAAGELNDYLAKIVRERRTAPTAGDVLINAYLGAEFDGKPLPEENIASQMATLVIGSSDSFPKIFAAGLLALHRNPAQRAELVRDRSGVPRRLPGDPAFWHAHADARPDAHPRRRAAWPDAEGRSGGALPLRVRESRRARVRRSGSLRHPPGRQADPDLRPRESRLSRHAYRGARGRGWRWARSSTASRSTRSTSRASSGSAPSSSPGSPACLRRTESGRQPRRG